MEMHVLHLVAAVSTDLGKISRSEDLDISRSSAGVCNLFVVAIVFHSCRMGIVFLTMM